MGIIRREVSELRFNALFLLPKDNNPHYYMNLFRNAKNFFMGMNRPDLVETLNEIIHEKIEVVMGVDIQTVLLVYKNIPYMNGFTRSKNTKYNHANIYKHTIQGWLDEIEAWIFQQVLSLERLIRFQTPARQFV